MLLYSVNDNGSLKKITKLSFAATTVFVIDDYKTIYVWNGQKATKKKKDLGVKAAEKLNKERKDAAKIQKLDQNKEFGAFLGMMNILKKGIPKEDLIERRPELELAVEETKELVEAGLDLDLEGELTLSADEIARKNKTYEELCRELAKLQLKLVKGKKRITEMELIEKTEEILKSSSTYEELCWLIAQMGKLSDKKDT